MDKYELFGKHDDTKRSRYVCWIKYPKNDNHKLKILISAHSTKEATRQYAKAMKFTDHTIVICCLPMDGICEESVYAIQQEK